MFCPNCGNNCGNANFCPNCGNDMRSFSDVQRDSQTEKNVEYYYQMYAPNREAAIAALRADTGMGAVDAIKTINEVFDMHNQPSLHDISTKDDIRLTKKEVFANKKRKLDEDGQIYCPKCLSTSISANKKGFGFVRGALGANLGLDIGMIVGGIGSKKVMCTCLKCGYQWTAGKK